MDLFISKMLLDKLGQGNSCMDLPDGKASKLFTLFSKIYIVIASCSTGREGMLWVNAYECILEENHKEKSFTYNENYALVNEGKKDRGYTNVKFEFKGVRWVIINDVTTFKAVQEEIQLSFF